jgi:hypothetical protein
MAVEELDIAFGATAIASGDGSDGGSVVATFKLCQLLMPILLLAAVSLLNVILLHISTAK